MTLIDQIKNILDLLEEAKLDLESWVDCVEEEEYDIDTYETKRLIGEIKSMLHDVGH